MTEPVQICRGFTDEQWNILRTRLNNSDESAWGCAIEVFKRRINERYFSCIDALINGDSKQDIKVVSGAPPYCSTLSEDDESPIIVPGFAILALCCLLAETLQSFREKPQETPASVMECTFPNGKCIKPATISQVKDFLLRPAFRGEFSDDKIRSSFVKGIRNGIFHEAETRRWVIWRDEPQGRILASRGKGYALNRTEFYRALKDEFQTYITELQDPTNKCLRYRFVRKMTDIAKECS